MALTTAVPAFEPNVTSSRTCPAESVTALSGAISALTARNETRLFGRGLPAMPRAWKTIGSVSRLRTTPRCPSPATKPVVMLERMFGTVASTEASLAPRAKTSSLPGSRMPARGITNSARPSESVVRVSATTPIAPCAGRSSITSPGTGFPNESCTATGNARVPSPGSPRSSCCGTSTRAGAPGRTTRSTCGLPGNAPRAAPTTSTRYRAACRPAGR